ncbi:MAG: GTP-binding protein YchF [Candidatus Midichloriaceae bacterium]|jgi:GTP-binding protein YchF|nr:GTP-binding protein YchF [Candidatus Midichloriaceae bacterium]
MELRCGIVGLPNVGKSTLFNALTQTAAAEAANYPFCTIEPNVGRVSVPDHRLTEIAKIAGSAQIIPTQIEFVDIAGLVRGASKGEGLGNQFLSHIREVDAIIHVVRCFEDGNIVHVEGSVDPLRDAEIIELELILADMDSLEKRLPNLEKKVKQNKELLGEIDLIHQVLDALKTGKPARVLVTPENSKAIKALQIITSKPVLYAMNVSENEITTGNAATQKMLKKAEDENAECVMISAQIESEIAALESDEEKKEFLESIGLAETGLAKLIKSAYHLLGLITYLTVGPKEARAWTINRGMSAPQAAGVIHTDFEKGFIRAETVAFDDYIKYNGESGARDAGKLRLEGKEYIVNDGDIIHFRFNT